MNDLNKIHAKGEPRPLWFYLIEEFKMDMQNRGLSDEDSKAIIQSVKHTALRTINLRRNMLLLKSNQIEEVKKIYETVLESYFINQK